MHIFKKLGQKGLVLALLLGSVAIVQNPLDAKASSDEYWTVTIPKIVSLSKEDAGVGKGNYIGSVDVRVAGDIHETETITVNISDNCYLTNELTNEQVDVDVYIGDTTFTYDMLNKGKTATTEHLLQANLTAGHWTGLLDVNIDIDSTFVNPENAGLFTNDDIQILSWLRMKTKVQKTDEQGTYVITDLGVLQAVAD